MPSGRQLELHPECGRSVLDGIEFLAGAREIVHSHHERWDGNGYPRGLQGTESLLALEFSVFATLSTP